MNRYDIALLIIDKLRISPTDSNGIMIAYRIADELLALFEQEKKEIVERKDRTMQQLLEVQKREIFRAVHYKLLGSGHSYLIKDLAKEYGVNYYDKT